MTQPNSSFSEKLPTLQLYMDSTSLGTFKTCPRKYYYSMILGRQPAAESVHLTFGILMHEAIERYHKARARSVTHEDSLREVVAWAMRATWDRQYNRPWSSGDKKKNRATLIRTIIWYLDQQANDDKETVILQGGKPAVELPFTMDSGYTALTGEPFTLCGKLDRIVAWQGGYYVTDVKTTGSSLTQWYFNKYTPDVQMSMYSLAGSVVFGIPVQGIVVDACQVAIEFSAFQQQLIERTEYMLTEWQEDLGYWFMNLNHCADTGKWPRNDAACGLYGGCPFRPVCSQTNPIAAEQILFGSYRERQWDPLRNRLSFSHDGGV